MEPCPEASGNLSCSHFSSVPPRSSNEALSAQTSSPGPVNSNSEQDRASQEVQRSKGWEESLKTLGGSGGSYKGLELLICQGLGAGLLAGNVVFLSTTTAAL